MKWAPGSCYLIWHCSMNTAYNLGTRICSRVLGEMTKNCLKAPPNPSLSSIWQRGVLLPPPSQPPQSYPSHMLLCCITNDLVRVLTAALQYITDCIIHIKLGNSMLEQQTYHLRDRWLSALIGCVYRYLINAITTYTRGPIVMFHWDNPAKGPFALCKIM